MTHRRPAPPSSTNRLVRYGDDTFTFDDNGDLVFVTGPLDDRTFTYDAWGNLLSFDSVVGADVDYRHDPKQRRVERLAGSSRQYWIYSSALDIVAEYSSSGALEKQFVYGLRGHVPAYMLAGGDTFALVSDIRGSVRLAIDIDTGTIKQRRDYDPFGVVLADTDPEFQPFGFAGGLYDPLTGLVRFGARDYDAWTGRWTAKDPIRFNGGDTNLYGYVRNDPVNRVDPSCRTERARMPEWLFRRRADLGVHMGANNESPRKGIRMRQVKPHQGAERMSSCNRDPVPRLLVAVGRAEDDETRHGLLAEIRGEQQCSSGEILAGLLSLEATVLEDLERYREAATVLISEARRRRGQARAAIIRGAAIRVSLAQSPDIVEAFCPLLEYSTSLWPAASLVAELIKKGGPSVVEHSTAARRIMCEYAAFWGSAESDVSSFLELYERDLEERSRPEYRGEKL